MNIRKEGRKIICSPEKFESYFNDLGLICIDSVVPKVDPIPELIIEPVVKKKLGRPKKK